MKKMLFEYSAGAFIYKIIEGKVFLLFLRSSRNNMDVPKGHIEKGETVEEAATREIKEEAGLTVTFLPYFRESTQYFFVEDGDRIMKKVYFFIANITNEKVEISKEHKAYSWLDKEEAIREMKFKDMKERIPRIYDYIERYELIKDVNKEYQDLPTKTKNWNLSKRFVPGHGPLNAETMIIGQAPGRNEDIQGKPFVGRSGEALNEYLKKAKIKRDKVYITSVVQFFPPENRAPTKEEIVLCKGFLLRQIELIKPKRIILLGNIACETLLGNGKVTEEHGKVVKKDGIDYMITLHPAMALRSSKTAAKLLDDDFKHFGKIIAAEEKRFKSKK